MAPMLQLRPFFEMRQTGTHIPGFQPGIAAALATIAMYIAGGAFVPCRRPGLINNRRFEIEDRAKNAIDRIKTGDELWRFYTVPGDPSKPFEGKHLEAAAKTWTGEWWKGGGGGTDSIRATIEAAGDALPKSAP